MHPRVAGRTLRVAFRAGAPKSGIRTAPHARPLFRILVARAIQAQQMEDRTANASLAEGNGIKLLFRVIFHCQRTLPYGTEPISEKADAFFPKPLKFMGIIDLCALSCGQGPESPARESHGQRSLILHNANEWIRS